jgi:hypothetical protein
MIDDDWTPMTLEGELEDYQILAGPFAKKLGPRMSIHWKSKVPNPSRKNARKVIAYLTCKGKQDLIRPNNATAEDVSLGYLRGTEAYKRDLSRKYAKYKYVKWETDPALFTTNADGTVTPTAKFERELFLSIIVYILEAINLRECAEGPSTLDAVHEDDDVDFDNINIYA